MRKPFLMTSLAASLILSAASFADSKITINNEGLYPEGISYSAKDKHFYISSVAKGEIWRVNKQGKSELFAQNNKFASAIGLQVDTKRNRLLVCISDPGVGQNSTKEKVGKVAGLAVYDLSSKKQIAYYQLAALNDGKRHLANDVTVDDKGNIYVTDSFSPIIYKIDPKGNISHLVSNEIWKVKQGHFGLNGIVYHPAGFLIVAHYATGKLYRIDLKNPEAFKEIVVKKSSNKWKVTGLDGLLLQDNKTLIAVNNDMSGLENANYVFRLSSENNWASATMDKVMPTSKTFPTTLTRDGNDVFVLHAKLGSLFTKKAVEKSFEIEPVLFSK